MFTNRNTTRRQFLAGCSTMAAAACASRLTSLAFADPTALPGAERDILVVVFLRGGMDGLNLIAPVDDRDYLAARAPAIRLSAAGEAAALPIKNGPTDADFRIHRNAAALKDLYDSKDLAIIHACGLTNGTRSHFEAQDLMERGVADMKLQTLSTGWLTRHLEQSKAKGLLSGIAASATLPSSLLGYAGAAAIPSPQAFAFYGDNTQLNELAKAYRQSPRLAASGQDAVRAIHIVQKRLKHKDDKPDGDVLPYTPADGIKYPDGDLSESLKTVAWLIKADVGLQAAAVDYGGWDTHQEQANNFPNLVEQLSGALSNFYNDLSKYRARLNIVVMSEFGRRFKNNESNGTDHGHGNAMLVLGGNVNGGKIYGRWPGLATEQLDDRADLAVTTDYRTVLAELISRRFNTTQLKPIFPGMAAYQPLGIFRGAEAKTDLG